MTRAMTAVAGTLAVLLIAIPNSEEGNIHSDSINLEDSKQEGARPMRFRATPASSGTADLVHRKKPFDNRQNGYGSELNNRTLGDRAGQIEADMILGKSMD